MLRDNRRPSHAKGQLAFFSWLMQRDNWHRTSDAVSENGKEKIGLGHSATTTGLLIRQQLRAMETIPDTIFRV